MVKTAPPVFVKFDLVGAVRNVEAAMRKAVLRRMSSNEGAVGIRLDYYDTGFCFLTAHFTAEHSSVEEWNAVNRIIVNGLHFLSIRKKFCC